MNQTIKLAQSRCYVPTFLDGDGIILVSVKIDLEDIRLLEYTLIQKWLRVKCEISADIKKSIVGVGKYHYSIWGVNDLKCYVRYSKRFRNYEYTFEQGLIEAIKLI
ncbi:MAG: hypothetical protein ACI9N9_000067 [Enterobacterales bacterium]|jgi:hypothetical protein